jgi:hypothetical protein
VQHDAATKTVRLHGKEPQRSCGLFETTFRLSGINQLAAAQACAAEGPE